MPIGKPLPALLALLCLAGVTGCSSSGFVESFALAPTAMPVEAAPIEGLAEAETKAVQGEVQLVSAEPVVEPFTEMAYATPAAVVAPAILAAPAPSAPKGSIDRLIAQYSAEYGVPEQLIHRVVKRESTYNPLAHNGGHYGLMQIKPETARIMGFRGAASDLYNAETNLKFGVKYLRGAWLLADGSQDRAVQLYSAGYYYEAKRRGMLVETGLRSS